MYKYILQIGKHSPSHLGCPITRDVAGLVFLPTGMTVNGQKYTDLLKDKLELHMAVPKCKILM